MTRRSIARWITPLVLPYLMLTGCSLIGFGIGAIIDGSESSYQGPVATIDFIEVGSKVGITKTDSSRVVGVFQGVQTAPNQAYAISYLRCVSALDSLTYSPAYNEQVRFVSRVDTLSGLFRGYDRNTAWVAATAAQPARGKSLDSIDWIVGQFGRRVQGRQIRDLIIGGRIPSRSNAVISGEMETYSVNLESIASVYVIAPSEGSAKWVGLGVGAVLDVVWIALAVSANETADDCNSSSTSCNTSKTR